MKCDLKGKKFQTEIDIEISGSGNVLACSKQQRAALGTSDMRHTQDPGRGPHGSAPAPGRPWELDWRDLKLEPVALD